MSRTIDNRVVEMRFDNKDFEENVSESMSTLDRLKKALDFGDAGKSFNNISKAASDVDLDGLGGAIDTISSKFSALEIAGITALMNITNKAVDAGLEIVQSLTIDQISEGFDKYADKTTAVQTIMAATKKDFHDEGEQMEYVNDQLGKLNWFTDETSYNFVDMVSNIGKFTNTGTKLNTAVTSMQGIANWAAISGANAVQASRAMYNVSQAMGAGYMKLIDWKSIENANMATMEFKEMAIQAALALGTLKEENGEIWTVDNELAGKFEKKIVTAENMASTLSSAWLTNDVMNEVLNMYGSFTDALYDAYEETGLETFALLRYTEDYANGLLDLGEIEEETGVESERLGEIFSKLSSPTYDLGRRAFKAAQETKTFAEVLAYTKDAVSSGWMNTFELIFGDYQEAKEMWSNLSEVFYDIFVKSGEARNEMLTTWKELGGRTSMLEAVSNTWQAIVTIIDAVKDAFHEVFPPKDTEEKGTALYNLTEKVRIFTEKLILTEDKIQKLKDFLVPIFTFVENSFGVISSATKALKGVLLPVLGSLFSAVKLILSPLASCIGLFFKLIGVVLKPLGTAMANIWGDLVAGVPELMKMIDEYADKITQALLSLHFWIAGLRKDLEPAYNFLSGIGTRLSSFFSLTGIISTFKENGGGLSGVLAVLERELSIINSTLSFTFAYVVAIVKKISGVDISGTIFGVLADTIHNALEKIKNAFNNFRNIDLSGIDGVVTDAEGRLKPLATLLNGIRFVGEKLWAFIQWIGSKVGAVATYLGQAFTNLREQIAQMTGKDVKNIAVGTVIILGIIKLAMKARDLFWDIVDKLQSFKIIFKKAKDVKDVTSEFLGVVDDFRDCLSSFQKSLDANILIKIAVAIGLIAVSMAILSRLDPEKLAAAFGAITASFIGLMASFKSITSVSNALETMKLKQIGAFFIEMAAAVLILAFAIKKLGKLDLPDLAKGLIGVKLLCSMLTKAINSMKIEKVALSNAAGVVLLSVAIGILASSVKKLSKIDFGSMMQGLLGVGILLAGVWAFLKFTDIENMSVKSSIAVLVLSLSIGILASAAKKLSKLDLPNLALALTGIASFIGGLLLFTKFANTKDLNISSALGILGIAIAIRVLASATSVLAKLSWEDMGKGLIAVMALLIELLVFVKLIGSSTKGSLHIIAIAFGLAKIVAAIQIIFGLFREMESLDNTAIIRSLLTMAGIMAILSGAFILISFISPVQAIAAAAAVLVMALSLKVLVSVLQQFAAMNKDEIIKSLAMLGGVLAILGVAGLLIGPLAPLLLLLGAAMVVIGLGMVALGAGAALMGIGLTLLATTGSAGVSVFVYTVKSLLLMLTDFIGEESERIANAVIRTIKAFLLMFRELIPYFAETIVMIIDAILKTLVKYAPSIVESLWNLLVFIFKFVIEKITTFLTFLLDKIMEFFGIEKGSSFSTIFLTIGKALIEGLINGIKAMAQAVGKAISNLASGVVGKAKEIFGIKSPSTVFEDMGENIDQGLANGIDNGSSGVIDSVKNLCSGVVGSAGEGLDLPSIDLGNLFSMPSNLDFDFSNLTGLGDSLGLGDSFDLGGLGELSNLSESLDFSSLGDLTGDSMLSGFGDALGEIENTEISPEVTPVLNLDDLDSSLNSYEKDLSVNNNVEVAGMTQTTMDGFAEIQNELKSLHADVNKCVVSLREDLSKLGEAAQKIKVVMDTGALVGALTGPIDEALGERTVLAGRGV